MEYYKDLKKNWKLHASIGQMDFYTLNSILLFITLNKDYRLQGVPWSQPIPYASKLEKLASNLSIALVKGHL